MCFTLSIGTNLSYGRKNTPQYLFIVYICMHIHIFKKHTVLNNTDIMESLLSRYTSSILKIFSNYRSVLYYTISPTHNQACTLHILNVAKKCCLIWQYLNYHMTCKCIYTHISISSLHVYIYIYQQSSDKEGNWHRVRENPIKCLHYLSYVYKW